MTKRRGKQQGRVGKKQQAGRGWKTRTLRAYPVTLRLKAVEQVERGVTIKSCRAQLQASPPAGGREPALRSIR